MTRELKVEIDRLVCIGSGTCARLAPSAFKVDENGRAVVLDPSSVDEKRLRSAERVCPSGAIRVFE
jgi:ferredoxin